MLLGCEVVRLPWKRLSRWWCSHPQTRSCRWTVKSVVFYGNVSYNGATNTEDYLYDVKLWKDGRLLRKGLSQMVHPTPAIVCVYMKNVLVVIQWHFSYWSVFTDQWWLCFIFQSTKLLPTSVSRVVYLRATSRTECVGNQTHIPPFYNSSRFPSGRIIERLRFRNALTIRSSLQAMAESENALNANEEGMKDHDFNFSIV